MTTKLPLLALLLLLSDFVPAQGIAIRDGLWEFTTKSYGTGDEPKVKVEQQCFTGEPYNPAGRLGGDCAVEDQVLSDNQLTWRVICTMQNGSATGDGIFTADDNNAQGSLDMLIVLAEQEVQTHTTWEGQYIGECEL